MFLSLYAMNQRYGWLRCMEALAIIRMKMIVSVVQNTDTFFFDKAKTSASVLSTPSRNFLVFEAYLKNG